MREKIAKIIETENSYGYYAHDRAIELADQILALIESQRCEWTYTDTKAGVMYRMGCSGRYLVPYSIWGRPFCPCCGRKIEVKDAD